MNHLPDRLKLDSVATFVIDNAGDFSAGTFAEAHSNTVPAALFFDYDVALLCASANVPAVQAPALSITKAATETSFNAVGAGVRITRSWRRTWATRPWRR